MKSDDKEIALTQASYFLFPLDENCFFFKSQRFYLRNNLLT